MEITKAVDLFQSRLYFFLKEYNAIMANVTEEGNNYIFDVLVDDTTDVYAAGFRFKLALQDYENITINVRTINRWIERKGAIKAWSRDEKSKPRA